MGVCVFLMDCALRQLISIEQVRMIAGPAQLITPNAAHAMQLSAEHATYISIPLAQTA